mgnify:CR=1 FL=1
MIDNFKNSHNSQFHLTQSALRRPSGKSQTRYFTNLVWTAQIQCIAQNCKYQNHYGRSCYWHAVIMLITQSYHPCRRHHCLLWSDSKICWISDGWEFDPSYRKAYLDSTDPLGVIRRTQHSWPHSLARETVRCVLCLEIHYQHFFWYGLGWVEKRKAANKQRQQKIKSNDCIRRWFLYQKLRCRNMSKLEMNW